MSSEPCDCDCCCYSGGNQTIDVQAKRIAKLEAEIKKLKEVNGGLEVEVHRAKDGKLVVDIDGPSSDADLCGLGTPDIRIWLNEALIYDAGEVGEDLGGGLFLAPLEYKSD